MTTSNNAIPASQPVFGSIHRANSSAQPPPAIFPVEGFRHSSGTTLLNAGQSVQSEGPQHSIFNKLIEIIVTSLPFFFFKFSVSHYILLYDSHDTCRSFVVIRLVEKDKEALLQPRSQVRLVDSMIKSVGKSGYPQND